MRVAIIEDERELAQALKTGLESEDHAADVYFTARTASDALLQNGNQYDLILLDLMLPDGDGREVCTKLREAGISTPILVLTARDSVEDKIDLLDRGADDFLGKPFSFDELIARARALARRGASAETESVLGELRIVPSARAVYRLEQPIALTAREFDLLHFLIRNQGRVIDREELLRKVWKQSDITLTNVVDVHVRNLRKKIDDDYDTKYIQTVHGVGYTVTRE